MALGVDLGHFARQNSDKNQVLGPLLRRLFVFRAFSGRQNLLVNKKWLYFKRSVTQVNDSGRKVANQQNK